jgi:hypothetical protein
MSETYGTSLQDLSTGIARVSAAGTLEHTEKHLHEVLTALRTLDTRSGTSHTSMANQVKDALTIVLKLQEALWIEQAIAADQPSKPSDIAHIRADIKSRMPQRTKTTVSMAEYGVAHLDNIDD